MIVRPKTRNSWKILLEHGDIRKIHEFSKKLSKNGISMKAISNAINNGRTSEGTFEAIQKFLKEKIEENKRFDKENALVDDQN